MAIRALIPAAGAGTRMGGVREKQFLLLAEKPIVAYTLEHFEQAPSVQEVVLMVPPGKIDYCWREIVHPYHFSKVRTIVAGGETRQDSVYRGFQMLATDTEWVLIHDGVRPFISAALIEATLQAAQESGAAIVALPEKETIKRISKEGYVLETLRREELWRVQTPQAFRYTILHQAFQNAYTDKYYATDESALVERLGYPVKILPGSPYNVKITTPEDLLVAEAFLEREATGKDSRLFSSETIR